MKPLTRLFLTVITPILLFSGGAVFAQAVKGSGGGGLSNFATAPRGCEEGRVAHFFEKTDGRDKATLVTRTCKNGSYYDLSDYIYDPKIRCREGFEELWLEHDYQRDSAYYKKVKCINGKWVEIRRW